MWYEASAICEYRHEYQIFHEFFSIVKINWASNDVTYAVSVQTDSNH